MAVHVDVHSDVSSAPRAQLVDFRGRPMICVAQTAELHDALNSLAALGVKKLGYRFRFDDSGGVVWESTTRRGAGRDPLVLPDIKAAQRRLGELLVDAIREAVADCMGPDREVRYDCNATFKAPTASWQLSGSGTAYAVDPDFFDVGLALG